MVVSLLGASLLWVNTYGTYLSYDLNGSFSGLRDTLLAHGHSIEQRTDHVDAIDLSPYDVVIVCLGSNWNGSFTASEAHALAQFVRQGKGLLIMSENNACPNGNLQALMDTFSFTAGGVDPGDVDMSNFTSEAPWANMFAGVSALHFDDPGAVTGPNWLIEYGGNYFAAAQCFGAGPQGVPMIIGDINIWDNTNLNLQNNKTFLLNVVSFLENAAQQCASLEVSEEPVPAEVAFGVLRLEPGARAEIYSVDGRLVGVLKGPGHFELPRGVSVIRIVKGNRTWRVKAIGR